MPRWVHAPSLQAVQVAEAAHRGGQASVGMKRHHAVKHRLEARKHRLEKAAELGYLLFTGCGGQHRQDDGERLCLQHTTAGIAEGAV